MFVGLTGGIACGKSLVAKYFQELGAHLIDADAIAHLLMEPGQQGHQAVVKSFGSTILQPPQASGSHTAAPPPIDRVSLGSIIFSDPRKREQLESILHPLIFSEAAHQRAELETAYPGALILFEAPLLMETGADTWVDCVITVFADEETQRSRLMSRDHLTPMEAQQRLHSQLPVEEKRKRATYCIDGATTPDEVQRQVRDLYHQLKNPR